LSGKRNGQDEGPGLAPFGGLPFLNAKLEEDIEQEFLKRRQVDDTRPGEFGSKKKPTTCVVIDRSAHYETQARARRKWSDL